MSAIMRLLIGVALFFTVPWSPVAVGSLLAGGPVTGSNQVNPEILSKPWTARWIYPPGESAFGYGVYHFRKEFSLGAVPDRFVVHVSGDNRYQLFVNGACVAKGPARGDLNHWRFETVDVARWLHTGDNVVAAVVWNYSEYAPEAQVTNRTGFILQGDGAVEQVVNTDASWKCLHNPAYTPIPFTHAQMRGYFVAGPGEVVDGSRYPWGWERLEFDDSGWSAAVTDERSHGSPRMIRDAGNRWMLVPSRIPPLEERPIRFASVRRAEPASLTIPSGFPAVEGKALSIPAHASVRLLLDQGELTTGYPEVLVSGGRGAEIEIGYAEALFSPNGEKGNRSEVDKKEFVGNFDRFQLDGGRDRLFRPLWWRTWRYVQATIRTAGEPLVLEDIRGTFSAYPFERKARFEAGSQELERILEVGWRTARLCAHDTYMDCPYYEQLQYVGDARIQAMVSYYNAGDGRLARNAIALIDDSRISDGLTMSRAPTRQQQLIPPFSLWWIGMVHDYWMYQDDPGFVRERLPGIHAVLDFYAARQGSSGSLSRMPWWNFVDWINNWPGGESPGTAAGDSSILDLQLLMAYDWAADLEQALGTGARALEYRKKVQQLSDTVRSRYWDPGRRLVADTQEKESFSQHANALAILAGVVSGSEARTLIGKVLDDRSLTQSTYYFRYYVNSAAAKSGEGNRYLDLLDDWRVMLTRGLSTWAERPDYPEDPARSDCHAWSAHPNIELFRTVLGIDSTAPGFREVVIRPHPGKLRSLKGAIPHPRGSVGVSLKIDGSHLSAEVSLPEGINGVFEWQGKKRSIKTGTSRLEF